jgi:hypothetical protein
MRETVASETPIMAASTLLVRPNRDAALSVAFVTTTASLGVEAGRGLDGGMTGVLSGEIVEENNSQ